MQKSGIDRQRTIAAYREPPEVAQPSMTTPREFEVLARGLNG
jgi:hypothetical protein